MKILLLSDTNSEHTEKWALGLANSGIQVGIFSFNKASYEWHNHPNITIFFEPDKKINAERTLTKLSYVKYVTVLKKIIKHFQPDILHAHYATSYGLVGALTDFHPFIISAWGTDVMKFPNKNYFAKSILKYNFKKADLLCATSKTIEEYMGNITKKPVSIVPFGISLNEFKKKEVKSLFNENDFVIGSVKNLESIYNLDVLIKAFANLSTKHSHIKLMIVGKGSQEERLKELCERLEISNRVIFTGRIPHKEVSNYYNMLNVLVNASQYESFGVSVIEAMACEVPVIVSNVGGLKEVVRDDTVGLKVSAGDVEELEAALERLISDKNLHEQLAKNGRKHAEENYDWKNNLASMIEIYNQILAEKK
ncbi:MAG: glycosyltransferase [Bacteroidetes bacterium]|nr:glycosyltransferase [Bacteroidota bacterium]